MEESHQYEIDIHDSDLLNESDIRAFNEMNRQDSNSFNKVMEETKGSFANEELKKVNEHFEISNVVEISDFTLLKFSKEIKKIYFRHFVCELREISNLVDKFLHHCAKLIQTFYRIHKLKPKTQLFTAIKKGWKVRKLLNIQRFQDLKREIVDVQNFFDDLLSEGERSREFSKQIYNSLMHKKTQFIVSFNRFLKSSKWLQEPKFQDEPLKIKKEKSSKTKFIRGNNSNSKAKIDSNLSAKNKTEKSPSRPIELEKEKLKPSDSQLSLNSEARKKTLITNEKLDWSQVGSRVNCWNNQTDDSAKSIRRQKASSKEKVEQKRKRKSRVDEIEKAYYGNYSKKLGDLNHQIENSKIRCETIIPFVKSEECPFINSLKDKEFIVIARELETEFQVLQGK